MHNDMATALLLRFGVEGTWAVLMHEITTRSPLEMAGFITNIDGALDGLGGVVMELRRAEPFFSFLFQ